MLCRLATFWYYHYRAQKAYTDKNKDEFARLKAEAGKTRQRKRKTESQKPVSPVIAVTAPNGDAGSAHAPERGRCPDPVQLKAREAAQMSIPPTPPPQNGATE